MSHEDRKTTARRFLDGDVPASVFGPTAWGPNGKIVFDRTYSRPLFTAEGERQRWTIGDTEGRTHECWAETARRVTLGNSRLHGDFDADEEVEFFLAMLDFDIIPGGRHLWVDGTGFAQTRNCFSAPMGERTSGHFKFLGSRLFEGGGVGANYSNDMLALTTPIGADVTVLVTCDPDHTDILDVMASANGNWIDRDRIASVVGGCHDTECVTDATDVRYIRVEDTREGWVSQWVNLIDTACGDEDAVLIFDVTDIRPFGSPLVSTGGTASGPAPLVSSLIEMERVLRGAVGRRLTTADAMDMDHAIAASVVAGGTRRSARLAAKHWGDEDIFDFIECKADMSKNWSANISVEIDDDFEAAYRDERHPSHGHAVAVMDAVIEGMHRNGEPGFLNSSRLSEGERTRIRVTNPCAEIPLETEGSEYGEACNIGSVNLHNVGVDVERGERLFWLLARFLYRSTLKPYPDAAASHIEGRNRRIGAGFMGMQEWALHHGVAFTDIPASDELTAAMVRFRAAARAGADSMADELGTPRSIKVTCVAPNGSISKLPGVGAGMHPVIARYAEQRIRFGTADPKLEEMRAKGYDIEPCIYAKNTMVVTIPTKDAIMEHGFDESLVQQANEVSLSQFLAVERWVTDTFCGGGDGNAVSATANFEPDSVDVSDMREQVAEFAFVLKGTTVFPSRTRQQQPITPISREDYEEMVEYCESMVASMADDCSTGACPVR